MRDATSSAAKQFNELAVALEEGIRSQWRDNQSRYDALWKKVKEAAQVTDRYKDDFRAIMATTTKTLDRSGDNPLSSFVQTVVPSLSDSSYTQLMRIIESGRDDFKQGQTALLDRQRRYRTHLRTMPGSLLAGSLGYPQAVGGEDAPPRDRDGDGVLTVLDYDVVLSSRTRRVFQEGAEDEPIQVFDDDK